ncbi:copper resistance protein B [Croceicoccus sp. BE223]|uniref:copper resistance protein B n=1 Tax=Croceicoccus sp. BE223 TaxID=2817716 RepID=UPI00285BE894|nr:copper resistance protein B [Croceicoccus sp. BE223]MDR7101604.1 copper resistance protein B [Croceicoccus sp. BE223]
MAVGLCQLERMKNASLAAIAALSLSATTAHAQSVDFEVELFELQAGQGDDPFIFDSSLTVGGDSLALVLKAEGGNETARLDVEEVESQALLAFAPADGTTLLAGVRHDFRPGGDLTYASFGIEQALGSILEAEHYLFVSERGDVTGSGELVAGLPLGPSLTLEPRAGIGWSAQAIAQEDTGSGLSDLSFAVRLRQAIGPVFDVYVGAVHERLLGDTRDIARAAGDRTRATRALVGAGMSF